MNIDTLSVLTGTQIKDPKNIINQAFTGKDASSAGCWINTTEVHSICKGVVISVERDLNNMWCVTVEVDSKHWVRYCCLSAVRAITGSKIEPKDFIGYSHRGLMRFEYCTAVRSKFPVRIAMRQLYKADPAPILFGQENLSEVT